MFTKSFIINAVACDVAPNPKASSHTLSCHNLRRDPDSPERPRLKPVGHPVSICQGRWRPITRFVSTDSDDEILIVADDCDLAYIVVDRSDVAPESEPVVFDTSVGAVSCAVVCDTRLTVMTSAGPRNYRYSPNPRGFTRESVDSFPTISLLEQPLADYSSYIGPRTLSKVYAANDYRLRPTDRSAVTSDLVAAYSDIATQAAALGAFIAPTLCRYRLIGHDGRCLFTSPPLLLGTSDSARLTEPVVFTSLDHRRLDGLTIGRRAWRIRTLASSPITDSMRRLVDRVEILATPQFHPFNPAAQADIRLVNLPGSDSFIRATIPGADTAVAASNAQAAAHMIARAVDSFDTYATVVASIPLVHIASDGVINLCPDLSLPRRTLADAARIVARMCAAEPAPQSPRMAALTPPHTFSAGAVAASAGAVVWANITPKFFRGYPLEAFAASRASESDYSTWHATANVRFADGSSHLYVVSQGAGRAPQSLGPLISYPHPDAVGIDFFVRVGNSFLSRSVDLRPTPGLRHAVYISPDLQPIGFETGAGAVISSAVHPSVHWPSTVITARADDPCVPIAAASLGSCPVVAVSPTCSASGSLNYSNTRFAAFTPDCIVGLSLLDNLSRIKTSTLHHCGIASPAAVTHFSNRLIAIAGRSLVEIVGSHVRTLFTSDSVTFSDIATDDLHGEIRLAADGVPTAVIDLHAGPLGALSTRDDSFRGPAVGPYVSTADGIVDLSRETAADGGVPIRWVADVRLAPPAARYRRLKSVTFDISSSSLNDVVADVSRLNDLGAEISPACRLAVTGRVAVPLSRPCISLPLCSARVSIAGRVAPDTRLSAVSLQIYENVPPQNPLRHVAAVCH